MTAEIQQFETQAEWLQWQADHRRELAVQHVANVALSKALITEPVAGDCVLCGIRCQFICTDNGRGMVSFRESLLCPNCLNNARQRAVAQLLLEEIETGSRLYVTEQASHFYFAMKKRCRLQGSEFTGSTRQRLKLWLWLWRYGHFEWLHREDITHLSFADRSLDAIATLDVLEHVPDVQRALVEFARVLRPGGHLILTVPFYCDQADSIELARVDGDGEVEHLQVPEYHGDPLGGGVLCFHHFAWDLLARMRSAGFSRAMAVRIRDPDNGLPESLWILRAVR
ncbi:MAG: hypothetical protein JWL98_1615 [Xanthomonadaceae bacterium]|nr:hypothetical protein [Xanthomonadaceae bacterium]